MRARGLALVALLGLAPTACKTLSEVSIGYADAVTTSSLPAEPYAGISVAFPSLTGIDPLSSPSLTRYAVTPDEVESVKLTSVELEADAGACGLPFARVELQLVADALGPTTIATATREGECLAWTLADEAELGPWFRQPQISIVALVDGEPAAAGQGLSLRVSFLVDVKDKRID